MAVNQMKKARIGRPRVYKHKPVKKNLALSKELNARIERHLASLDDRAGRCETFTSFCQRALIAMLEAERR